MPIPITNNGDDGTRYRDFAGALLYDATICVVGYESVALREAGVALLFRNIPIAQGAVVGSVSITLTARVNRSNVTVNSRISAYDADNGTFVINRTDYATKFAAKTTAQVDWDNIGAWTQDIQYTSPDIATVIQEIVNRPGWNFGNDILIFWEDHENRSTNTGNTSRLFYDYGLSPSDAAVLNITGAAGQLLTINIF